MIRIRIHNYLFNFCFLITRIKNSAAVVKLRPIVNIKMFEARLSEGDIFKKVLNVIKERVNEVRFDCSEAGLQLHAMDSSQHFLVNLNLRAELFENYRCDRKLSMGMNLVPLAKIVGCSNNDDVLTIRAQDEADVVKFVFESKNGDLVSDFDMKLMNLDQTYPSMPESDYDYACTIKMSSGEFARIVGDLSQFGKSITVACTKQGVKFSSTGKIETGNIKLLQNSSADSENNAIINFQEPVTLTFNSSYLNYFAKAAGLSDKVALSMSPETLLLVEFKIASDGVQYGYVRYYMAPLGLKTNKD